MDIFVARGQLYTKLGKNSNMIGLNGNVYSTLFKNVPVSPVSAKSGSGIIQLKLKEAESIDPFRVKTSHGIWAFILIDTADPAASAFRIQTTAGVKALAKNA